MAVRTRLRHRWPGQDSRVYYRIFREGERMLGRALEWRSLRRQDDAYPRGYLVLGKGAKVTYITMVHPIDPAEPAAPGDWKEIETPRGYRYRLVGVLYARRHD